MKPLKLILTSFDYLPRVGGVATCASELAKALAEFDNVEIRVLAPKLNDLPIASLVATRKLNLPKTALVAAPFLAGEIRREIREYQPHALLSMLWMPDGLAASFAPSTVPYFVFAHGVELMETKRNFKKRLRAKLAFLKRRSFLSARGAFAVSHNTAKMMIHETGIAPEKIKVVFNGVDAEKFQPAPAVAALKSKYNSDNHFLFMTVCRLVPNKGIDQALMALADVRRLRPLLEWRYVICGTGPDESRLRTLCAQLELNDHVTFAGAIANSDLVSHYNLADCFVLLSREEPEVPSIEGFGIVFLEAAACAKPSLAGKSGGIADAVQDGVSGWLVAPSDKAEIAARMIEILENPDEVAKRGQQARERVNASFTWKKVAQNVTDFIRSEIERTP